MPLQAWTRKSPFLADVQRKAPRWALGLGNHWAGGLLSVSKPRLPRHLWDAIARVQHHKGS